MNTTEESTAPEVAPDRAPAGIGTRVLARGIDTVLALGLVALVAFGLAGGGGPASPLSLTLVIAAVAAVEASLMLWWGRTPGKYLTHLAVETADGQRVPWWRGFLRTAFLWAVVLYWQWFPVEALQPLLVLATIAVVVAPAVANPDRRAVHDRLLATVVVRAPRP